MSSFRKTWEVVLDGEPYKVTTKGPDMANAERMAARDGFLLNEGGAVALQQRMMFIAFRRGYPDNPLGRAFGDFVDVLDDITDQDELEAGSPLDPIPPADTDG